MFLPSFFFLLSIEDTFQEKDGKNTLSIQDFLPLLESSANLLAPHVDIESLRYELSVEWSSLLSVTTERLEASSEAVITDNENNNENNTSLHNQFRMNYSDFCDAIMKLVLVWTDQEESSHVLLSEIRDRLTGE